MNKPYLINFSKIGSPNTGYLSICEKENLIFIPKRIYWTYLTPENIERGGHAHKELEQILVAVSGKIQLTIQTIDGDLYTFILDNPSIGVFIPKKSWRTMKYNSNAVQMCFASLEYDEKDYIRNYDEFSKLILK
jgi:hypothetical protein